MTKIILVLTAILLSTKAYSMPNLSTQSVCSILQQQGLSATKNWHEYEGLEMWGCNSTYKELGSGSDPYSLANNLAFYADGSRSSVTQVKLVLNVNNRNDASFGHKKLLEAASALSSKVLGKSLSENLKKAIINGKPTSEKLNSTTLEVKRDNWPTGKGYEVHFIIK